MLTRILLLFAVAVQCLSTAGADDGVLFENSIRPVLVERCIRCHGPNRQSGAVRLDEKQYVDRERLLRLVDGSSTAPDVCQLKLPERKSFADWVDAGLPWPESSPLKVRDDSDHDAHWAFQPVRQPAVPDVANSDWVRTPIDAFVLRRLAKAGLSPSDQADRRTLVRRLYYSLTGLPPSADEVDQFVSDPSPDAYRQLVDRLLDSPRYGEHWARHWLDVARYSDTKGYVYGREERFWAHAWSYRDWVVSALNRDLPFDRFLQLQLAADQLVDDPADGDLAAMGFLTLGRRFLGVERDIIDDRIDVVTRGTMALTVSCARCHDHMYDPIPTADYYSLYGVFESSQEELVSIGDLTAGGEDFQKELAKRRATVQSRFRELRDAASKRSRERTADYLFAQTELEKYPATGFDQVFSKTDLLPAFVHRWTDYLQDAHQRDDPVFTLWHRYADLPEDDFAKAAATLKVDDAAVHPLVAAEFQTAPESMRDVADCYGRVFADVDRPGAEALRAVMFGPEAPAEVPDLPIVHSDVYFDTASLSEVYKLEGEVSRWINQPSVAVPQALVLRDRANPVTPHVFVRGNPLKRGPDVPRQVPAVLARDTRRPFQTGSGRLELARAITDRNNPLTARVMVNRVWAHHFGQGLVDTPSDFGVRAGAPSHPELLDWLASRFVEDGWSLKSLHRLILLSATWQQASMISNDDAHLQAALSKEPSNRLLWRMNARRLSWEQFRDSMLAAANELDLTSGGRPVNLFSQPFPKRRTLYGLVDRQFLPSLMRTFDFANPDLHIPQRLETTVPQQSLFFMNDPLVLDRSRALAAFVCSTSESTDDRLRTMFRQVWQRNPTSEELEDARTLLTLAERDEQPAAPVTAADWQYGYGEYAEADQRVVNFNLLPHFTGEAWQGGPKWPDAKLGWVQLTADGGHPGNTRSHASVRRWTAPRDMTITVRSRVVHERPPGDGIRTFIVSSRAGLLANAKVHQQTVDLNVDKLQVEQGETIDFVVDIGDVLNSDEHLWSATLNGSGGETSGKSTAAPVTWNSQADFPQNHVQRLTGWEQLAQTLLASNEFLFVD
jgi:hypothetical protein